MKTLLITDIAIISNLNNVYSENDSKKVDG